MARGEWQDLPVSSRLIMMESKRAIKGSILRTLAELITNSDDSYTRLEEEGIQTEGFIEIGVERGFSFGSFYVLDFAEGMTDKRMEEILKWGGATSGILNGVKTRGYFGRGLKDSLISMEKGVVISIKDGMLYVCNIEVRNGKPQIKIHAPGKATKKDRKEAKIPSGNGTIVFFKLPKSSRVPQFDTLRADLSRFYMLRKVNQSQKRRIKLVQAERLKDAKIRYVQPAGEKKLDTSFQIEYEPSKYKTFDIELLVFMADDVLEQTEPDRREGGILVVDEENVVLDLKLFGYDKDPCAARIFGEMKINNFRQLLTQDEYILSSARDGLDRDHIFTRMLTDEIYKKLTPLVEQERDASKKAQQNISNETRDRHKNALQAL